MDAHDTKRPICRILLVDDHTFTSLGAKDYLERQDDLVVVGTARSSAETFEALASKDVDVAVIDLVLGSEDGLALVKQIASRHSDVGLIVLSMHDEKLYADRALRAGALGYVMKGEDPDLLIDAIRSAHRGEVFLSEDARAAMANRSRGAEAGTSPTESLSDRELTVFRWLGEGLSTREIAEALHLSTKTVHTYRERIKTKLGLSSGAELVHHAIVFARPTHPGSAADAERG